MRSNKQTFTRWTIHSLSVWGRGCEPSLYVFRASNRSGQELALSLCSLNVLIKERMEGGAGEKGREHREQRKKVSEG